MSNKSKFISASTTIILTTSIILGTTEYTASANPFSTLWQKIKTAGNSLTLTNPFKSSNSSSSQLNKPSSSGKLSSNTKTSNNLCTKLKNFFSKNSKKSYKVTTTQTINPAFEEDTKDIKSNTITHTLKGNINVASKSKEKRARLAAAYSNDAESLTSNITSSDDANSISSSSIKTELKSKTKSNNPNVSFDELSISSEDSIPESEIKNNSSRNSVSDSDLISDLKSELEIKKILINEELLNKSLLEKDINESNDVNVKQGLYLHLDISNEKIVILQSEIETLQQLIKDVEIQSSNS